MRRVDAGEPAAWPAAQRESRRRSRPSSHTRAASAADSARDERELRLAPAPPATGSRRCRAALESWPIGHLVDGERHERIERRARDAERDRGEADAEELEGGEAIERAGFAPIGGGFARQACRRRERTDRRSRNVLLPVPLRPTTCQTSVTSRCDFGITMVRSSRLAVGRHARRCRRARRSGSGRRASSRA